MARRRNGRRPAPARRQAFPAAAPPPVPLPPGQEPADFSDEDWTEEEWIDEDGIIRIGENEEKPTIPKTAVPYITAGLPEVFALAIANNIDNGERILDLYEAKWWKQYDVDDPLILSVLDGKFTSDEAEYINSFRSDHGNLATACIEEMVPLEWARSLLDSGFNGNMDAVTACLDGGEPSLIARIMGIKGNKKDFPPGLTLEVREAFRKKKEAEKKKKIEAEKKREEAEKRREEAEELAKIRSSEEKKRRRAEIRKERRRKKWLEDPRATCSKCGHTHQHKWIMCDSCGNISPTSFVE